jgi:hypothetical protein
MPRNSSSVRLLLAAFAVYRAAGLIALDSGPFGAFERLRALAGRWAAYKPRYSLAWSLAEGLNCPYCLGVWLAAPAWGLVRLASAGNGANRSQSKISSLILGVLGIAGMQAFLNDLIGGTHAPTQPG